MTSLERAMEMMYIKQNELPKATFAYMRHLARRVGLCMEVCITAYAAYAECVEGLEAKDEEYMADPTARSFFTDWVEPPITVTHGTSI